MPKNITLPSLTGFLKTATLVSALTFSLNGGGVRASMKGEVVEKQRQIITRGASVTDLFQNLDSDYEIKINLDVSQTKVPLKGEEALATFKVFAKCLTSTDVKIDNPGMLKVAFFRFAAFLTILKQEGKEGAEYKRKFEELELKNGKLETTNSELNEALGVLKSEFKKYKEENPEGKVTSGKSTGKDHTAINMPTDFQGEDEDTEETSLLKSKNTKSGYSCRTLFFAGVPIAILSGGAGALIMWLIMR